MTEQGAFSEYVAAQTERARVALVVQRGRARLRWQSTKNRLLALLRPPRESKSPNTRITNPASWLYHSTHPERGLTVEDISRIFTGGENGEIRRQVELIDGLVERDPATRNLFEQRINAVTGKPWTIMSGDPADEASNRAAELLSERLARVPSLGHAFEFLLTHNRHGFAAAQMIWSLRDGLITPTWFAPVLQSCFRVAQPHEKRRRPDELLIVTERSPMGERLKPGQWLTLRRSYATPVARAGLGRTAAFWLLFKLGAARDFAIFVHRFGIPFALARCDWADEDSKAAAAEMVANLGSDGGGIVSKRVEVTFPEPATGRSGTVHPTMIGVCDVQLARLIHGSTLPSGAEGGGGGSYALGRVHDGVRWENVVSDAKDLTTAFSSFVAEPFMRFNNLPGRAPILSIQVVQALHPRELVEIAKTMKNDLGLSCSEQQLRALVGLRGADVKDVRPEQREAA